jgi:hypothetical protein
LVAISGRFANDDLPAILDHLAPPRAAGEVIAVDGAHSAQPSAGSWAALGAAEVAPVSRDAAMSTSAVYECLDCGER